MQKVINTEALREALSNRGLTQKQLAETLGVSSQAVTNWLKQKDFPRPAKLLKLTTTLHLTFDELVKTSNGDQPIVAFRKKGGAKTTSAHIAKAHGIGMLLKPLVPYLPELQALRTLITSPTTEHHKLQVIVAQTRDQLGIGERAVLEYEHLIGEFKNAGAILVPVLWGEKKVHENALHIRLPQEDVTFIFLNLDTRLEDFKFWLAHELAHVYTPELAGSDDGEDFADAFAGALLFPRACVEIAYRDALKQKHNDDVIRILQEHAHRHMISLNTVYQQLKQYAKAEGLPTLSVGEQSIHAVRNSVRGQLISDALFDPTPPAPDHYIAASAHVFQSDFFNALKRMLHEKHTGSSYIQQVLDSTVHDAKAIYEELRH
ncbi:MAG: XRE family transcriptional regulator [Pseudomonadota bacterium]